MELLDLFKKQNKSRKIVNKMKQGKSVNIVCFGDSITWGHSFKSYITNTAYKDNYPSNLEHLLQNFYDNSRIKVHNEGHHGWTSRDAIRNENGISKVLELKPDLVILMFGINEVIRKNKIEVSEYKDNISFITRQFKKNKIEVLILSPTPIHLMDNSLSKYAKAAIDVSKDENVYRLDLRSLILEYINQNNLKKYSLIAIDNVHFWGNKYKIISEIILNNFFI